MGSAADQFSVIFSSFLNKSFNTLKLPRNQLKKNNSFFIFLGWGGYPSSGRIVDDGENGTSKLSAGAILGLSFETFHTEFVS